jgi:isoleucyl-tRNA synthetase
MYKKVDPGMNFVEREKETLKFWKNNRVFEKTNEKTEGKPVFSFYDGPPTANGKPHIGHILTRVMKDIIPRYKIMKGYSVLRKAGWDTHGLPVELEVEKSLGIDGKQEIEAYGIEPFIKKCKESVWKYKGEWERMSDRVGYWVDMDHPYITYDNNYIESVWWSLKEIDKKGLLYRGFKIVPYCPRCGTALSSHEVAQGYKDVKEKSAYVKFALKSQRNTYFLAWTTTPWTLPSNVALCMNADENYARIKSGEEYYILADALISAVFEAGTYEKIDVKKGKEYEFVSYEPLFDFYTGKDKAFYITCDGYVTLTDGTGIVHIAPAFGEDDAKVGRKYSLPLLQMVDEHGRFPQDTGYLSGLFCKDADKFILKDLKERNLLFKEQLYEHSYPFCWRCDTPLLYYARKSWFIKTTAFKDLIIRSNDSVNWMPETIRKGRMGNFLENLIDWGVSRERYWGTPLPVWVCEKCGKKHVIGSRKELHELSGCDEDIELHRPYIDKVTFPCECGGVMRRVPEVIDCWYDSGSMPFAQFHYPFENQDLFEKNFPADFISEAIDQTRGWFYVLLAISSVLFEKAPFKSCIVLGHVNDKDGIKMSKHKGNVVDPWSVLDKQGADAVRWYFYTSSAPWLPSRFAPEIVSEVQRKFLGTLWNTYAFFVLYAEIDKYDPSLYDIANVKLSVMDRWILSELNTLIDFVDKGLDKYNITDTSRAIEKFTDNLSNWYVRRCRERFWGSDMSEDKIAAYTTLYTALTTLAKLAAPFVPFITEQIYGNLVLPFYKNVPVSVHLTSFPVCDKAFIDTQLGETMDRVINIVSLGRTARNACAIKNRQPLSELLIRADKFDSLPEEYLDILKEELNVKKVAFISDSSGFASYEIKPQLRTLGPKYGPLIGKIREHLAQCDSSALVNAVRKGETVTVSIDNTLVAFKEEDLLISDKNKEGYQTVSEKGITVILNTELSQELIQEGLMRELVSKIQTMRKESGFNVTDHIVVTYSCGEKLAEVIEKYKSEIMQDTLADSITAGSGSSLKDINGEEISLSLEVVGQ